MTPMIDEDLSMAVACVSFAWKRDEQLARDMREEVMRDYGWGREQWDEAVNSVADYTCRNGSTEDVEQFLCVGFGPTGDSRVRPS